MLDMSNNYVRSDNYKWMWEIHKNCDQLLHQRLAAFTAAQAMTLASFTVLTVARFQAQESMPPLRVHLLDTSRILVALFGLLIAIFGWLVTYPMLARLQSLNKYLTEDPIYKYYIDAADKKLALPFLSVSFPLKHYRNVIPIWLPASEAVLWVVLLAFTAYAFLATLDPGAAAHAPGHGLLP